MPIFFQVNSCCWKISLRKGCIICAIFNLIFTICIVVPAIYFMAWNFIFRVIPLEKAIMIVMDCVAFSNFFTSLSIVISCIMMLVGLLKRRRPLMLQWLIHELINTILLSILLVILLIVVGPLTEILVGTCIYIVIKYPILCMIHSYYVVLKGYEVDDRFGTEHKSWRELESGRMSKEEVLEKDESKELKEDAAKDGGLNISSTSNVTDEQNPI